MGLPRKKFAGVCGIFFACLLIGPIFAQGQSPVPSRIVAFGAGHNITVPGQPAPGLPGLAYGSFLDMGMSQNGQLAFEASSLVGPDIHMYYGRAFFAGPFENPQLIYRAGSQAPGLPDGYQLSAVFEPRVDAAGDVAGTPFLTGDPLAGLSATAVYLRPNGGQLTPIAAYGQAAPGAPASVMFQLPGQALSMNPAGQMTFGAYLTGTGAPNPSQGYALYYHPGASDPSALPQLIAIPNGPAPDTSDTFSYLRGMPINPSGIVVFQGHLTSAAADADTGLWMGKPGNVHLVVREGTASPITGVNFGDVGFATINGAGQIAFTSHLSGVGVDASNNVALLVGKPDQLEVVARRGAQAPQTAPGVSYDLADINRPLLSAGGRVLFTSALTGPGVTTANDKAIFAGAAGNVHLIAREGDPVPGLANATFTDLFPNGINAQGQVSFAAFFVVAGSTSIKKGLWATLPDDTLVRVTATGDALDLGNGVIKTILGPNTADDADNESGANIAFSDAGQIAFEVSFTDTTEAVVVATVPEPASIFNIAFLFLLGLRCSARGR
jgi:hypothetical protein